MSAGTSGTGGGDERAAADVRRGTGGDERAAADVSRGTGGLELQAEGGHGAVPVQGVPTGPVAGSPGGPSEVARRDWPLWEVFVRPRRGLAHGHVGSLHAPDAAMALRNARDVYTRRGEGVSIWVVEAVRITASSPDEKDAFFDPAADKIYRHPTFYEVPAEARHL